MKKRIIYLAILLAAITACSDSMELDPERYYPSLDYAHTATDKVFCHNSALSFQTDVESSCDWICLSDCDWISAESTDNGDAVTVNVGSNNQNLYRSGNIYFYKDDQCLSSTTVIQAPGISANCYIVSEAGDYAISAVKGNTTESLDATKSVEVLWETYGTAEKPEKGSLIKSVIYQNGAIGFTTSDEFREGNAVIAAKDVNGKILWSWHIWLTDYPQGQVYYNNAGTFMDRNLGATSATPGDVGALGLMYQWGRKDPFLGASDIEYDSSIAESTIKWPSAVYNTLGTLEYTLSHPTTYVADFNHIEELVLWTIPGETKSVYDPCPAGWRIPDGGAWEKAAGSHGTSCNYDTKNEGVNFSGIFGSDNVIWYPAAGIRASSDYEDSWVTADLLLVGAYGDYWSASFDGRYADFLHYYIFDNAFDPRQYSSCGYANSVRCIKGN